MAFTFAKYPALMTAGGSAHVNASGYSDPLCGNSDIVVICQSAGKYVAFAPACNHQCCPATFSNGSFRCPCHGARWDANGKLTQGPATADLPALTVCADATGVYVSY